MHEPQWVKLRLGETSRGTGKWLQAYRATADYYGWTKEFPIWTPKTVLVEGGRTFAVEPGRRGGPGQQGGRSHRICRAQTTGGFPAGFTNRFKVSTNVGLFDLAELAHFTDVDWHWMTGPTGDRVSRAAWEERYQATNLQRRGGLVSV